MKAILIVEYLINGMIIRISIQYQMEEAVMNENSTRFSLENTLPIFNPEIIKRIENLDQSNEAQDLIYKNITIDTLSEEINSFLALIYQPNPFKILTKIDLNY